MKRLLDVYIHAFKKGIIGEMKQYYYAKSLKFLAWLKILDFQTLH